MPNLLASSLLAATLASVLVAQEQPTLPIADPSGQSPARLVEVDGALGFSLRRQDGSWTQPTHADYRLGLRYRTFDPLTAAPQVPAELTATANNRLFIVQYHTQGLQQYRDVVTAAGGKCVLFLANYANIYNMDLALAADVQELPFVRAVVPFHPAYKLDEQLLAAVMAPDAGQQKVRVNLLTTTRDPLEKVAVAQLVEGRQGRVEEVSSPTHLMSVTVRIADLPAIAGLDEVQWIDLWSPPEGDMDIVRAFHGMDYVETQAGVTGQGLRIEVLDGGCDENHPDLQNYLLHGTNTPSAHGTCCAGIVLGSGANNFSARGGLPDAFLIIGDYNYISGGSRYAHTGELTNPSMAYRTVLQSNSWGNARTTSYSSISQDMDLVLFDHARISILQSQSNAGNQDSRPQAWAKNIISVGGVRHYGTLSKSDDAWNSGASIGPAADGRIKPDIASFYDGILATDQVGSAGYTSSNYYSGFGGTSGATPASAGMLGGFYELWNDGVFGNATPGADAFENAPNNTTAKAMLINTSSQWAFSGTNHDLTRVHQGWGHPDLQKMYDRRSDMLIVDESVVLSNLQSHTHNVTVAAGTPELKVTMVYRDPPGTTSSSLHRINNLDLKVTAPGGAIYWGNFGLDAANYSAAGGSANGVDTVENVFVQNPTAGSWTIEVIAAELNQDSHVETTALDCDYALVASGVSTAPVTPPADPTGLSAMATGTDSIALAWTDNAVNEDGYTIERSNDGVNFATLTSTGANAASFIDTGLSSGTTYHYRVFAFNTAGTSATSNIASATTLIPQPPASAAGLGATAASDTAIDLSWTDASNNEDGFSIERADAGVGNWAQIASVGAGVESHVDGGLTPQTGYDYRVIAFNTVGSAAPSNVASATTLAVSVTDHYATGQISGQGTVSGSYTLTTADDGQAQQITERLSGGKPSNRHSYLVHTYTIPVAAAGGLELHANAWHSVSPDGDDFEVQWSFDNQNFTTAFVVTATSDGTNYAIGLPGGSAGTVYVRIVDTDQTPGAQSLDTFFMDELFVRATGSPGSQPPLAPTNAAAAATSATSINVTWDDNAASEDGYEVERSTDGVVFTLIATTGAGATSHADSGLTAQTQYFYRVRAFNTAGASGWSNTASATTPGVGTVDETAIGETSVDGTVTGSYLDTISVNGVVEEIEELRTGGKPANRITYLEHEWTFNVTGGSSVAFHLRAWKTTSSDGDDFEFAYSTDGVNYTNMMTVTGTTDPGSYSTFALPAATSGTVYVRVRDTDRTAGSNDRDSIFVEHMFMRSQ